MAKIKLNILLALPSTDFLAHIGGIYEKTPWVVEQFYNDNLSSTLDHAVVAATKDRISNVKILFDEIKQYVKEGGREKQLELLKSHPDLCLKLDPPSEKSSSDITRESRQEQGRAGLSTLTTEERTKFHEFNNKYKTKFQFPFILAVRNASKYTVLSALEGRVDSSIEEEIGCALSQVDKIAWMRLLTIVDYSEGSNGHGGFLTCHVLDTANGSPASGMRIELYRHEDGPESNGVRIQQRILLKSFLTNSDGRLGGPALSGTDFCEGQYEWVFYVGDYFAKYSLSRISGTPFLDVVPLRFGLDDPTEHYHVPLLVSPWSYSTYRGS
mmetsp:Transcript_29895/g.63407  ORF Transcript_29895/g.63407 Transcript_29895/m.63407 type:complete len:326 (-) Transcript_29895:174-1151(-)|eukprot:CAMPEP_0172326330 /NCGR_PEP_ID=MMETSP1058-20130122/56201_1 /TAXON_ID=83371 /ORGANISM="Detonula confervacea, Strain CCMP 353" /LENGTH=325 /DNA_ID=CAMNT_0013043085 /DNA_START=28 /DNA_END=1005 /DNA_ORIENTATION=-